MPSGTPPPDSSPESLAGSDDLQENRYHDFRIVGDKVRCTTPVGGSTTVSKIDKIPWFRDLDPNAEANSGGSSVMASWVDIYASIEEWTTFFITEKRIMLDGKHSCANNLSTRSKKDVVTVEANVLFPYYSYENRRVNGEVKGGSSSCPVPQIHLDPDCPKICLKKKTLYLIGTGDDGGGYEKGVYCRVCYEDHDLSETPCPRAQNFVVVDGSRELKKKIPITCIGACALCVRPNGDTLFNTSLRKWLCPSCEQKAVNADMVWYELDGKCDVESCINEDVFCMHDVEGCKHYMYFSQGIEHNLSSYEIPRAVEDGRLQPVMIASAERNGFGLRARMAREIALRAFKKGERITLEQVLKSVGGSEHELLATAMYETRLADYIADKKLFTLNKINGFIEKPNFTAVGPWLVGRLVEGPLGNVWHIPKGERITIKTRDSISYINKQRASDDKSDPLGHFVA